MAFINTSSIPLLWVLKLHSFKQYKNHTIPPSALLSFPVLLFLLVFQNIPRFIEQLNKALPHLIHGGGGGASGYLYLNWIWLFTPDFCEAQTTLTICGDLGVSFCSLLLLLELLSSTVLYFFAFAYLVIVFPFEAITLFLYLNNFFYYIVPLGEKSGIWKIHPLARERVKIETLLSYII